MLKIDALNQYYGGSHILRNVNLSADDGKLTVLLGRNGVGKSTLLRCLMGVVAAKSGSVSWRGTALGTLPPCARRGRARVRAAGPRDLSAADRRGEPAGRRGEPQGAVEGARPDLRTVPGAEGHARATRRRPSGGQQQQLAIGRALMSEPQLLILDEPTEGIQPSIIQDIGRTLRQLVDESKMTVLLVEQYYDFARSIADRYWVMSRGEIVAGGEARDMEANGVRELIAV
jgi:urea transport system ATP-binding protein